MNKTIVYLMFLGILFLNIPGRYIGVHHIAVDSAAADSTSSANDSEALANLPDLKMVLIVRGDSYLENKVAGIVRDSLVRMGYTVKTISHNFLHNENPGYYSSSIIFNGIKSADLSGPAKKYARTLSQTPSNILFFTVNGDRWNKKFSHTDGVSAATRTINPEMIAGKILCSFSAECNNH